MKKVDKDVGIRHVFLPYILIEMESIVSRSVLHKKKIAINNVALNFIDFSKWGVWTV